MYLIKTFLRIFDLLIPINSKYCTQEDVKKFLQTKRDDLNGFVHTKERPITLIWGKLKRVRILKIQ